MIRSAIIFFLVNYCAFLFPQPVSFSRSFESSKKNIPIAIISKHENYFHVLRYNKVVHDFTLERRNKSTAEIISFTPLKLDVINADWFNYDRLDYILHEHEHRIYFVFEKVLNYRREVFLKVIDTLGKTSDFISLAALERDDALQDFKFEYKVTGDNKLLVVGTSSYNGGIEKKTALLYDPYKQEKVWAKKLPLESPVTGYSQGFECNSNGDLFYMVSKPTLSHYKRKYLDHTQMMVPVFSHEDVCIAAILNASTVPVKKELLTDYFSKLYSINIQASNNEVYANFHFSGYVEKEGEKVFFMNLKFNNDLSLLVYDTIATLNEKVEKQLTFYDGSDSNEAYDKDYTLLDRTIENGHLFLVSERKDGNFYKELLLVKILLKTGEVIDQEIIPRKVFFFAERTRFKNAGLCSRILCNGNYGIVLLENPNNKGEQPREFKYHDFSKVGVSGGNMILYSSTESKTEKKRLFENGDYDYIPVYTQTSGCDFVFYLSRGKFEKFATLKLNP